MAAKSSKEKVITIKGARQHNLKNVDLTIPRNKLIVFTGVSGSGKSSLVFDTIYAEGQRRYVESLSSYARQFLERIDKPDVDLVQGISPAVAIEQKTGTRNSRSTVGTTTEVYDYLRLLYARIGRTYCFSCGKEVKKASTGEICDWIETQSEGAKFYLTFPLHSHEGRSMAEEIDLLRKRGFFRILYKNKLLDLNEKQKLPDDKAGIRILTERFKSVKSGIREKLADSIEITFKEGENRLIIINSETGEEHEFNKFYECCGIRYEEPEPRFFSFNNPFGACPVCQGFSKVMGIDYELVIPNKNMTLMEGAVAPFRSPKFSVHQRSMVAEAPKYKIPLNVPFKSLTDDQVELVKRGFGKFHGINGFFSDLEKDTYKMHIRILLARYRGYTTCYVCKGARLRKEALQVKVGGKNIYELGLLPITQTHEFFNSLSLTGYELNIADRILKELDKRLSFLSDVGLGYLTLDRLSSTLSGGETQRINLATALGSALTGTLYVLDEPSIGLHPRDNAKLIKILKNLRDIGNSVLVVEHDPEMMREADILVDMGPKAGQHGGEIIACGPYNELLKKAKNSLTVQYLSGVKKIPVPPKRRTHETQVIRVVNASQNNLKNVTLEIPLKKFVVVTGVSGSGKSTLVHDVIYGGLAKQLGLIPEHIGSFDEITGFQSLQGIEIVDQSPIGKSPRSNPASYIKVFELIRELFANTHQAKAKGYKPGFFSFNIPGGRCDACEGDGFIKVEMQFLADLYLECEDCKGTRYKKEVRDITYKGKNLVDVLNMTADEAIEFFSGNDRIVRLIRLLADVGLGYIKLGQPSNTLSGGEAQRIKLALHLAAQRDGQHTFFIFDEPTTGLHFDDIYKLLNCFNMLLDNGNSVLIIEHNLDVIKCADYIIDMGPEAGDKGGEVVATGTPEEIIKVKESYTGQYLRDCLQN
ncbi:MAG: UvrABC system protein A [Ignavibacteriales bacterium]